MINILDTVFYQSKHKGFGKCSIFGGANDSGVAPDEGLALASQVDVVSAHSPLNGLWAAHQPQGTTGLARRLNPWAFYCACRWDYAHTPVDLLRVSVVVVINEWQTRIAIARPVDWGPSERTGRSIDLSPGLAGFLGAETDDLVAYALWAPAPMGMLPPAD